MSSADNNNNKNKIPTKSVSMGNIRSMPLSLRFSDDSSLMPSQYLSNPQKRSLSSDLSLSASQLQNELLYKTNNNNNNISLTSSQRPITKFDFNDSDDSDNDNNNNIPIVKDKRKHSSDSVLIDKHSNDLLTSNDDTIIESCVNLNEKQQQEEDDENNFQEEEDENLPHLLDEADVEAEVEAEAKAAAEAEAADSEQDEDFANVDEIDGPILSSTPRNNEPPLSPLLSVQNSNKFDKNNDSNLKSFDFDYNKPVDDQLKKKLNERAAQLIESKDFNNILQGSNVNWEYKDFYDLQYELDSWFSTPDFSLFPKMIEKFQKIIEIPTNFFNDKYAKRLLFDLTSKLDQPWPIGSYILGITYISMGTFALTESIDDQLSQIRRNNFLLLPHLSQLIKCFKRTAIECRDSNFNLKNRSQQLFCLSTILYFIICVCLEEKFDIDSYDNNTNNNDELIEQAIQEFYESNFLQFLTHYIENWRWSSRLSMRIRNIINLFSKSITLQFGDRFIYKKTKIDITKLHGLEPKNSNKNNLSISPLAYQAFREDITSRYPNYQLPHSGLPDDGNNSNSLSQFLQIPRPKARNPINLSLAEPDQHLATPAPSPPRSRSSSFGSNNNNSFQLNQTLRSSKKSLQTNMSFPNLYPSDDENGSDSLSERVPIFDDDKNHDITLPFSIQEAANILSDNVEIKLSVKQLWHEKDLFMMTERGWRPNKSSDEYNYLEMENTNNDNSINIMKRVDQYYKDCLPSLNSLIFVLLQSIESNLSNNEYKEWENNEDNTTDTSNDAISQDNDKIKKKLSTEELKALNPELEIIRAKQHVLKNSSAIIFQLLRWFKLNHILKFEYFSVLLYDSRYFAICTALLNKFSENYSDKVFNKMLKPTSFLWKECSVFNDIYKTEDIDLQRDSKQIDLTVLSSLSYLLRILRKISGSKTQRIKELPIPLGVIFKRLYKIFNLDIYHPMLRIMRELTPFKNKRWKSEHMELISGVFLYEKLELIENWVTGKEISCELNDACAQEIALRALLQFYNFLHYELSMEDMGYAQRPNSESYLINTESESLVI